MSFEPIGERHAIQEVAFVVRLNRNLLATEIDTVEQQHALWAGELPKVDRVKMFIVGPSPSPEPVAGVFFSRFGADGSLAWRLKVDDNIISVNCLEYTRWEHVSTRAEIFFRHVLTTLAGIPTPDPLKVAGVALQYVDVFNWSGGLETYRADELIDFDSDWMPRCLQRKGPLWHLHSGWFEQVDAPGVERRLNRLHIDAVRNEPLGAYQVRLDHTGQLDYNVQCELSAFLDEQEQVNLSAGFGPLHDLNKTVISSVLQDAVLERIRLKHVAA